MAEPKPVDATPEKNDPEESPKLVAVSENTTTPESAEAAPEPSEPERTGVSKVLFGVVVVLLLLALGGLYAQTQHARGQAEQIAALNDQVEGLQVQLSAANTQIATYDMQIALVQDSVRDMYEKMGSLLELVSIGPVLGEAGGGGEGEEIAPEVR